MMISLCRLFIVLTLVSLMNHPHHLAFGKNPYFIKFKNFTLRSLENITLSGDSHLKQRLISLTKDPNVPSLSSGSIVYKEPLQFIDKNQNASAAYFATKFIFRINNKKHSSSGDGLTFFISAVPPTPTAGGGSGYFGLVSTAQSSITKFIAVEFDTKRDLIFQDPEGDHVGLNIDSLVSVKTAEPIKSGIDLTSGDLIYAWIYYHNDQKKLRVFLNSLPVVPNTTVLDVGVDLSNHFREYMYVGFSASSSERSTELHHLKSWAFYMSY